MSPRPDAPERLARLIEAGPLAVGLVFYALSHGRAPLALPALAAALYFAWGGRAPRLTEPLLALFGLAGALAGYLALGLSPLPAGPVPPFLLGPMCGLLVGVGLWCSAARKTFYAWLFAWLLVVLSAHGSPGAPLYATLAAMGAATLAAASAQGGLRHAGLRGLASVAGFAAVLGAASIAIAAGVQASEGYLVETLGGALYRWAERSGLRPSLGVQELIALPARSTGQESSRALFEVAGGPVERLRSVVLDRFDGAAWTTTPALGEQKLALPGRGPSGMTRPLELFFFEPVGERLPSPAGTVGVEGVAFEVRGGMVLRTFANLAGTRARLELEPARGLPAEPEPGAALLEVPEELRAALLELLPQITAGARSSRGRAQAIERFFHANFTYSLEADLTGKGHPLAVLVRERRPAYCIHFASAMAAMLRSAGIPARLVGGFLVEEPNRLTGRSVVRERDAHAWVEAWLPEEGRFVAFDPTPMSAREAALGLEPSGALGSLFGAIGSWLRRAFSALRRDPLGALAALGESPVAWVLLALLVAWWLKGREGWQLAARERAAVSPRDPKLAAWRARYLKLLDRAARLSPKPSETDDELLERLRAAHGEEAWRLACLLTERYRQARFGGRAATAEELEAPLAALESLLRESRQSRAGRRSEAR